jgi:protein-S-isoprenylcysteine O-methyltransferase Ste14
MSESLDQESTRKQALRWVIREIMGNLLLIAILFGIVGRLDWWNGWVLSGIYILWSLGTILFILPNNPQMLAERQIRGIRKSSKQWDITLVSIMGVFVFAMYILSCLDLRFAWSSGMPLALQVSALVICFLGYDGLLLWSMIVNSFFNTIVRIQSDRNHTVITTGPYRFVRHPGYLGTILCYLFTPLLLGSWWGLIPALGAMAVLIYRTWREDCTLQAELPGYCEYASRTKYRLLPGIW